MTNIEDKLQQFYAAKSAQAREERQRQEEKEAEGKAFKQRFLKLITDVIQEPCDAFCRALAERDGEAKFDFTTLRATVEVDRLPDSGYPFMEPRVLHFHCDVEDRSVRIGYDPDDLGKPLSLPLEKLSMELVEDSLLRLLADAPARRR